MGSIIDDLKRHYKDGDMLTRLIFINVGLFLLVKILFVIGSFSRTEIEYIVTDFLAMPSGTSELLYRFWTPLTYMFFHKDFIHLLFNMLTFYWLGRIFVDMLNGRRMLAVYILGGFSGALFYIIMYNLLGIESHPLLGASASILAIVIATATYFPNYTIYLFLFGPVKLKYLGIAVLLLDVITLDDGNLGGHFSHFGGAIFGFIWASQLKKGNDIAKGFMSFTDSLLAFFRPKPKVRVHYKSDSFADNPQFMNSAKPSRTTGTDQSRMDIILDKIAKSGYNSLSKEEKEILFKMSDKKE